MQDCKRIMLALITIVVIAACSEPPPPVAPEDAGPATLDAYLDDVFERDLALDPVLQSALGRADARQGGWTDVSDEFAAERIKRTRADIVQLRERFDYDALPTKEQLSYDLFAYDAERDIANHKYRRHHYVVDQFNGQLSGLLTVLQNYNRVASADDARDYVARIAGLESILGEMAVQLRDRAAFGVVAPAFSFPDVLTDARRMASGAPIDQSGRVNALYADFSDKLDDLALPREEQEELLDDAAAALRGPYTRGFAELIAELEHIQLLADGNHGVWSLPDGEAYYANRIRHHTTLSLSADEIHQRGLDEVARLHDEMRTIRDQVGFDGSLEEFFEYIRNDPDNYYADTDAGRAQFLADAREQIEGIYDVVGDWFSTLPKAELEVRRVEPWRENSTSIAFYNRPSEDGSRPGIYYANLADMTSVQKYVFSAITYHESVPGHHFQIALAQELPGLPKFRRFSGYGAFTEGWALYAEQLAKEMGFYENPYHDFGRLQNELWRAVRLVLDTGIHAERWSHDEAIRYFRANTPLSEGDIVTEVERFFVNPGQALGYKLGMMKILELRERSRLELGAAFDIRDFHDAVIDAGSLPLPLLERRVGRYIDAAVGG